MGGVGKAVAAGDRAGQEAAGESSPFAAGQKQATQDGNLSVSSVFRCLPWRQLAAAEMRDGADANARLPSCAATTTVTTVTATTTTIPLCTTTKLGLLFLHVPKAGGTSFVRALLAYGCDYNATTGGVGVLLERGAPAARGGGSATPTPSRAFTPTRRCADDRGRAVGVFRAPAARLASGFVHNFDCTAPMERAFGLNCTVGGDDYACAARLPRAALPAVVPRARGASAAANCGCSRATRAHLVAAPA